jgi:two-component system NtrC family sensor kinase
MATSGNLLTSESVLRLLFGALQPVLGFDAVASVQCHGGEDVLTCLAARPLDPSFATALADEVLEGLRRFSGESHEACARKDVEIVPLTRGETEERRPWSGPPGAAVDAPLIVAGRAVGLVRVVAASAGAFSAAKSAVIYATAQQASAFLEQIDNFNLSERRLAESIVNGLEDGILLVDRDMKIVLSNPTGRALVAHLAGDTPPEDTVGRTPLESLVDQALAQPGTPQHDDYTFTEENQRYVSATTTTPDPGEDVIVVLRDVTEEHLMQERLLQSEKMASVGQLVSGVAHELNNPLTGVTGFAQLLLSRELDEQTRHDVQTIYSEAERAAKIVQNLLSFARRRKAQKGLANLNTLLERVLELRSYDLRVKNIELELDLDPHLPLTMCDPDQIQQVLFNIITNAEHAMLSAHDGGKLKARTRVEKGYIHLSFTDDGTGIPPENLRRVFDPFFTTKEGGQGTGLGLTICYGIIDEHNGRIRVDSRPGQGSTFTIEVPIVAGIEPTEPETSEKEVEPVKISRRVLVVDDEQSILALLRDVLAADGHRVDTARNGEEALTHLKEHGYDLLITDIKMPGMGGQELYQQVKQIDSELAKNTVFITGDTVSPETRTFLQKIQNVCLAKPFKIREVRDTLNRLLGDN